MAPRHLAFVLFIDILWGFNFVAAKFGVTHLPPLLFTGLRFLIVFAVLAPFLRPRPGQIREIALIAVFGGAAHFALMFVGLSRSDAAVTAVLAQLSAPFATLLSILVLKETVGWRRWLGMGLAFGGVTYIGLDARVLSYIEGAALIVLAALSISISQVLMRRLEGVGALEMQAWLALVSAPILLCLSFLLEGGQMAAVTSAPLLAWAALVYTAVAASIIGHSGMYFLLQRYEVALVATLTLLAPIFGIFFSVLLLGERLGARVLTGAAIALLGVAIIAARQSKAKLKIAPAVEPVFSGAARSISPRPEGPDPGRPQPSEKQP